MIVGKKIEVNRNNRKISFALMLMVVILVIVDNSPLPALVGGLFYSNIMRPMAWGAVALYIFLVLPHLRVDGKIRMQVNIRLWALICGVITLFIYLVAGMIMGFGTSPYDHSIYGMVTNGIVLAIDLVAVEIIRNQITHGFTKKENYKIFIMVAIFFTLMQVDLYSVISIKSPLDFSIFISTTIGPKFCTNLLLTYLCFVGGPIPAMIYIAINTGFDWFSPIIPDLQWLVHGLIGIMVPIFELMFISNLYLTGKKEIKKYKVKKESFVGWIATCLTSIGLIWFVVGVFPIFPSVIATGSMEPLIFPGDIILVEKISGENTIDKLKIGDIIQFRKDEMMVCHRIKDIKVDEKEMLFITKGDNNSSQDSDPVPITKVRGKIIKVVPKVGWPSLLLKIERDKPSEPVEF